jgi:uncharacterized protein (DUF1499 family)
MSVPRELIHFLMLTCEEQGAAIRHMARLGWSDHGIAAATRCSVEQIRRTLGETQEQKSGCRS